MITTLLPERLKTGAFVSPSDAVAELQSLRASVYCKAGFLKPESCPGGRDIDKNDAYCVHIGVRDGQEGPFIAGLRLIFSKPFGFPLEEHTGGSLGAEFAALPKNKTAEISRLVVADSYRSLGMLERCSVLMPLFRELVSVSHQQGVDYWIAAMGPCLWRMLKAFHFLFRPIGQPIEFYGKVIPYAASIDEIEHLVAAHDPRMKQYLYGR